MITDAILLGSSVLIQSIHYITWRYTKSDYSAVQGHTSSKYSLTLSLGGGGFRISGVDPSQPLIDAKCFCWRSPEVGQWCNWIREFANCLAPSSNSYSCWLFMVPSDAFFHAPSRTTSMLIVVFSINRMRSTRCFWWWFELISRVYREYLEIDCNYRIDCIIWNLHLYIFEYSVWIQASRNRYT